MPSGIGDRMGYPPPARGSGCVSPPLLWKLTVRCISWNRAYTTVSAAIALASVNCVPPVG
jgi:hypothetical protein